MGPSMEIKKNHKSIIINGVNLAKLYLITSIVKFPMVISKNGILNGIVSIFLVGGICSSFSNILLFKLSKEFKESTYINISKRASKKVEIISRMVAFLYRFTCLIYLVDLSARFLSSISLLEIIDKKFYRLALMTLFLSICLSIPDPNKLISSPIRNSLSSVLLLLLAGGLSFNSGLEKVSLFNKTDNFYASFPLTFICFAQQLNTVPFMAANNDFSPVSIVIGSLISTLAYIIIGILGHSYTPVADVNWISNVENWILRNIYSLIFLLCNCANFPILINALRTDIQYIFNIEESKNSKNILMTLLTILFSFTSIAIVASKAGAIFCLVFSCLIMNILPSILYFKTFGVRRNSSILAFINFLIGSYFLYKGILDTMNAFLNK